MEIKAFECYNDLHSSLRDCNVCQIRFTDVLWSYSENKMTVLKIVIFQASVHVLPMGSNRAIMPAFGRFFYVFFCLSDTFFWTRIFMSLSPFFFPLQPSQLDPSRLQSSCATVQCIYISQRKGIKWESPSLHTRRVRAGFTDVHRFFSWVIILGAPVCCRAKRFLLSFLSFFSLMASVSYFNSRLFFPFPSECVHYHRTRWRHSAPVLSLELDPKVVKQKWTRSSMYKPSLSLTRTHTYTGLRSSS